MQSNIAAFVLGVFPNLTTNVLARHVFLMGPTILAHGRLDIMVETCRNWMFASLGCLGPVYLDLLAPRWGHDT